MTYPGDSVLTPLLRRHSTWSCLVVAVLAPAIAGLIGWLVQGQVSSYSTSQFVLAVVVSAVYGGWRPAVMTTVLSVALLLCGIIDSVGVRSLLVEGDLLHISLFVITALVIALLGQQVRTSAEQLQRLAAALESERATLQAVIENLPIAVGMTDADGTVLSLNREGLQLHGFANDAEMFERLVDYVDEFELLRPDDSPLPVAEWPLSRAMRGEFDNEIELILRHRRSGETHTVQYNVVPVRGLEGDVLMIVFVIQNLSDRRAVAAALSERTRLAEQREAELVAVLEQLPMAVWIVNEAGGVQYVSRATLRLMGHVARPEHTAEYEGQYVGYWPTAHARAGERLRSDEWPIARSLATGVPVFNEPLEMVRADGVRRQVLVSSSAIRGTDGLITGGVAVVVDITEQEENRRALEAAKAEAEEQRGRLALILDRLPVGVIVVDSAGAIQHHNAALESVLGHPVHPAASLADYASYGGVHDDGAPYVPEDYPIARALTKGETVTRELTRYRRGDGRLVTLSISAAPLRDVSGARSMAVATIEDVDERETALAAARRANETKTQFLRTMSHELRTPLHAIAGHVQLVELGIHGPVTPEQLKALGRVQRAQQHLLRLINDILEFSRLDAGRTEYHLGPVPVGDVVREVLPMIEPMMAEQVLQLHVDFPHDHSPVARVDREKLSQVLINLLSNAAKFTTAGGVVHLRVEERVDEGHVLISVADTGVGIDPSRLGQVFEPFVQIDRGLTSRHEGTGLGLSITRDLVRGMGGDISVASEVGKGSTFMVRLPRM